MGVALETQERDVLRQYAIPTNVISFKRWTDISRSEQLEELFNLFQTENLQGKCWYICI